MTKRTAVPIAVVFIIATLSSAFGQQATASPSIKISYKAESDWVKDEPTDLPTRSRIEVSGATFALEGKDGHWEKSLKKKDLGAGIEVVEFDGFNPSKPHTLSVRFRDVETLNGVKPKQGYHGEAFKYSIPPGASYDFQFALAQCDGKKVNTWITYALFTSDTQGLLPVGFEKGCKSARRWIWQRK